MIQFLLQPRNSDPSFARPGECTWSWLKRSTNGRAEECRRFINESLNHLPKEFHDPILRGLKANWRSAFFELVVARSLQELGASIRYEIDSARGRRLDILAIFDDGEILVEAVSPIYNKVIGEEMKQNSPAIDILRDLAPKGWCIYSFSVPKFGGADRRKDFRRFCSKVLDIAPPMRQDERIEIHASTAQGPLRLLLIPSKSGEGFLGVEPAVSYADDSKEVIMRALKRKREQAKGNAKPVIIALRGEDMEDENLQDADLGIFGDNVCSVFHHETIPALTKFRNSGAFRISGSSSPALAGVLVYPRVGWQSASDPVLYKHPRSAKVLPTALDAFEIRTCDVTGIHVHAPAQQWRFDKRMNWVRKDA